MESALYLPPFYMVYVGNAPWSSPLLYFHFQVIWCSDLTALFWTPAISLTEHQDMDFR